MRRFFEETSFLDRWHFIDDVYPEHQETVWFTANGKMYVGTYNEVQGAFIMADGEGIGLDTVQDWKALGEKKVTSYPKEKDIVAAEIPGLSSLVMGIFTDHAIDEETGDEVSAILLDDVYTGLPELIQWTKVFSWYLLPESPVERVVIKNIVETPEIPELPVEKEDIDSEEYDVDENVDFDGKDTEEEPFEGTEPVNVPVEAVEEAEEVSEEPETPEESKTEDYTSEIKKSKEEIQESIRDRRTKRFVEGRHKEIEGREEWLDEYNPKLPERARAFAKWWYHDMLGEEANPNFKQKYKGDVIDFVDEIFENYLGSKYTTKKDVGELYSMCPEEGQDELDDIVDLYNKKLEEGDF